MKEVRNESAIMEYSSSEKWDLFTKNFIGAWRGGFNLVPLYGKDNILLQAPLTVLTALHVLNFGIVTSLFSTLYQTAVDLISRKPPSEEVFAETKVFLSELSDEHIETIVNELTKYEADSKSSKALIEDLKKTKETISTIQNAYRTCETDKDPKQDPNIKDQRIGQKQLITNFFDQRKNLGKKTQQLICQSVGHIKENAQNAIVMEEGGFQP